MDKIESVFKSVEELNEHFRNTKERSVIMFADLADSTLYKQKRNFVNGLYKVQKHNEVIAKIVEKYNGKVIKYIGDAIMCEFSLGTDLHLGYISINAAIEIIETFQIRNKDISDELEKFKTKIGLAMGPVAYFYGNDPHGQAVDLASRIVSIAKPNQILVHKEIIDSFGSINIKSRIGDVMGYQPDDYKSQPVQLVFKGIECPQEIIEIKAGKDFLGIKTDDGYSEYLENYRFDAYLWKLDDDFINNKYIMENYFKLVYDLRYETVLKKDILRFVCVKDIEELNKAMHETNLFSRYMLPVNVDIINNISNIYQTDFVEINGKKLSVINDDTFNDEKYYFTQCFTSKDLKDLIGKKVSVRYKISTIINKYAHFYTMITEFPIKNLSMSFDIGDTDIIKVWAVDCFSSGNIPMYTYNPSKENIKRIEITLGKEEWIIPRSGVTFIWRLSHE